MKDPLLLANLARRIRRAHDMAREEPRPANYQSASARREFAQAELAEIELARRAAELMDAGEVGRVLAGAADIVRSELRALPPRLVMEIRTAAGDEAIIAGILADAIQAALDHLADRLERGARA
jgi:hypothetical protein